MKNYLLPEFAGPDDTVPITGDEYHRLRRVRRVKPGTVFPGVTVNGDSCVLTVRKIDDRQKHLILEVQPAGDSTASRIGGNRAGYTEPGTRTGLTLFQASLKGRKLDTVVRQATEAGAEKIVIVESEFCEPHRLDGGSGTRFERWRRIAREAVQQSGATGLPEIGGPVGIPDIPDCLNRTDRTGLFFHQERLADSSLHRYLEDRFDEVFIVVGPEGGFSERDTLGMLEKGYKPVFLGPRVLRAETAAVFAIGAVQIIRMESFEWVSAGKKQTAQ